jgi:hypothetical protein
VPDHEQIPLEQVDLPVLPGWGGEQFPEEKPRRDLEPAGLPTAAAVAAAASIGEEAEADFTHEDRRPLDGRRRKARGIDALILAPVAFAIVKVTGEITVGAALLFLALELSYFFVLETLNGQTVGKKVANLRVVRPDGSAPGATRIAVRTILRPIDYVIGVIVVLATGKRRLRIGDLLAGTLVRDDNRVFQRAPDSPLLAVFPMIWVGAAIAAMLALQPGDPMAANRNAHPYLAKIDTICEKQLRQGRALAANGQLNLISARLIQQQELRKIERLPKPPAEVRADVKEVLRHERRIKVSMDRYLRAVERAPSPAAAGAEQGAAAAAAFETAQRRFADMGLPNCARSGASG